MQSLGEVLAVWFSERYRAMDAARRQVVAGADILHHGCALLHLSSSALSLLIHFPAWAWTTSCPSDSDSRPCHLSLSGLDCPWMHIIVCAQLVSIDSWRLGLALADIFRRISRANGSHASAIRMASKQRALLHGSLSANAALFVIVIVVELSWVIHKIYSI